MYVPFTMLGVVGEIAINAFPRFPGREKFTATRKDPASDALLAIDLTVDPLPNREGCYFSISAGSPQLGYGHMPDDITRVFPELAHLLKWHLCSHKGPLHYISNTVFNAGERDCNGLLKGESKQLINGRSGMPSWELAVVREGSLTPVIKPPTYIDAPEAPPTTGLRLEYVPWVRVGEGKERNLDYARSCAVWPEATDEQLMLPTEELTQLLNDRLPALIEQFTQDLRVCGFSSILTL